MVLASHEIPDAAIASSGESGKAGRAGGSPGVGPAMDRRRFERKKCLGQKSAPATCGRGR